MRRHGDTFQARDVSLLEIDWVEAPMLPELSHCVNASQGPCPGG
jgi:hypothetical protein